MPVAFSQIPSDMLLPLYYAEVTQAREPVASTLRLCLIGHRNETPTYGAGSGMLNTPYILSGSNVVSLFGNGSMLHWMYVKARELAPFAEIWGVAIPTHIDAIRATGKITVLKAGTTDLKGVCKMHIAGRGIQWAINPGDTVSVIANRIRDAINLKGLPVLATSVGSIVTLTCRWFGYTGNIINISFVGPLGKSSASDPQVDLARVMVSFNAMAGGQGENEPTAALAQLEDRPFDVFCSGHHHTGQMASKARDFMASRWGPYQQLYGHWVAPLEHTFQTLIDIYKPMNDPHSTVLGIKQSVMPQWEWSAALAGLMVSHWANPPELSRPLQSLELLGMRVGNDDDESFSKIERQQLLQQGVSTFHVNEDGTCRVDRVRTLRKTNDWGDPDPSWADAITMFQAMYFVRQIRNAITGTYPRAALTNVPTDINGFTSPSQIRQLIIHEYNRMEAMGLVENAGLFSAYLVVERDLVDRNRVNLLLRPDMVNQLRVVATLVETHLELEAGTAALG